MHPTSRVPLPLGDLDERAEHAMVAMRDGVRLATDVYLPRGGRGAATVLVRLPYDKSARFSFMSRIATRFLERGYAFVAQDVRGKARSEGRPEAFTSEAADGADTLEWLASKPWSGGIVGMFGDSYYGFTQWAAAASGHRALRAIVPRMTTTRLGHEWVTDRGAFRLFAMAEWAATAWVDEFLYADVPDWTVRPLSDLVPAIRGGRRSESLDRWARTPPDDPFWTEGVFGAGTPLPGRVRLPVLHAGGWWDVFQRGQIRDFASLRASGAPDQHLVMGSTDHFDDALLPDGEAVADIEVDDDALERFLPGYLGPALEFFDRHLLERPGPPLPPVRWHLANAGWRAAIAWPPPDARRLLLFGADPARALDGPEGGALTAAAERSRGDVVWAHDPEDLVPDLVDDGWRPLLGLPDERAVERRPDVATFTSEPAGAALDLAGPATVAVVAAGEGRGMHLMAKLVDVYPSGRARRILQGATVVSEPASARPARIDLGHAGYRLPAGHRLRLEIASSDYPRYLWDPGSDEDPWTATSGPRRGRRLEVGGDSGPALSVTVLPSEPSAANPASTHPPLLGT